METLTFRVRAAMRCKRCSLLQPLAGLRLNITCAQCTQAIDIRKRHEDAMTGGIQYCFGGYYDVVAEALAGLTELDDASDSHGCLVEVKHGTLACGCGAPLSMPAEGQTALRCGACGDKIPVRWADGGTRAWDARAWCVIGDAGEHAPHAQPQTLSGTVVGCGACGGPLELQGKKRALVCAHCSADNFLGDAVWTKLFPYPEDHAFFMVYRLDGATLDGVEAYLARENHGIDDDDDLPKLRAALLKHRVTAALQGGPLDLKTARALVAAELTPADAARIDAALSDELVAALVQGEVQPVWLVRWGASERVLRRIAAAKKPGLHVALADPSDDVRAALAASQPPERLAPLAVDASPKVRIVIAGRRDTPPALMAALRKDADPIVKAAARANPYYQPGFFGKLFGA